MLCLHVVSLYCYISDYFLLTATDSIIVDVTIILREIHNMLSTVYEYHIGNYNSDDFKTDLFAGHYAPYRPAITHNIKIHE